MLFQDVNVIKISHCSGTLYAIKYLEDGHVTTKSIASRWLKEFNVKSVMVRGEKTTVSLLSNPNKNLQFETKDTLEHTIGSFTPILKRYHQFHTIQKLIANSSSPDDLSKYLFDLGFGELNFVVSTWYLKDYKLGARVRNRFEGELVHFLLIHGYLKYKPDLKMGFLSDSNWTKEMQKKFKRHRIYS